MKRFILMLWGSLKHWFGYYSANRVLDKEFVALCKMVDKRDNHKPYQYFRIGQNILYRDEFYRFYVERFGEREKTEKSFSSAAIVLTLLLGAMMVLR